jgi:WD40 repeat protein
VAVAPDGKHALSGDQDGRVRLWAMPGGELVRTFAGGRQGAARSVTFSPDGTWAFAALTPTPDGDRVAVWDVASGARLRAYREETWEYPLAFSPDGRLAVADRWDGDIQEKAYLVLWEVASGKEVRKFARRAGGGPAVHGEAFAARFTPDGKHVVSGDSDFVLRTWDARTGAQEGAMEVPAATTAWALSADARLALTAGGEDTLGGAEGIQLQLRDPGAGKLLRTFGRRFVNEP